MDDHGKTVLWIDRGILVCLGVLIFMLPIPHTVTVRTFAFYVPLALLAIRSYLMKDVSWHKTSFELPFVVFSATVALSLVTAFDLQGSLQEMWKNLIVPILYFYALYFAIKKRRDAVLLMGVLLAANFIFSLYSLYEFQKNNGMWTVQAFRSLGVKGACDVNGLYHAMITPFIFWGVVYLKSRWQKLALAALLALNLVALHITFTRAAYLATAIQMALAVVFLASRRRWAYALLTVVFLVTAGTIYMGENMLRDIHTVKIPSLQEFKEKTPEEIAGASPTATRERLALWKIAIDKVSKDPFRAHGYGRFYFDSVVRTKANSYFMYSHIHNTFIGMAFELGIQGFLAFIWMIGAFFVVVWKKWRRVADNYTGYFSSALLTMMAGYWVVNFFHSYDADDPKLLFMMLLGIGMAILHRIPRTEEARRRGGEEDTLHPL